jgi:ribonuclease HI
MTWKHFQRATDNTMELRALVEALRLLPDEMVVCVSMHSNYVKKGITEWIHVWKPNGWKNWKKCGVANATLWRELDTAITRQVRVTFTWVKARSGILLNEFADQLAT